MKRFCAHGTAVLLFGSLLVAGYSTPAQADTKPAAGVPATVSADALPTVQVNGVVLSQVVVGNTVYVTGKFTKARPAGVLPGGKGEVRRANLLAYDIRTGKLFPKFNHRLNGQGLTITRSPKGGVIYVGGDFTRVDGKRRVRIAAFSTKTGKLVAKFHPRFTNSVRAIAATARTVYVGGDFLHANGRVAVRLAKLRARNGARLRWAAKASSFSVLALKISPNRRKVVVAGQFTKLNGKAAPGIGVVSARTGVRRYWSTTFPLHDNGKNAGFNSLASDGRYLYGTGFNYLGANGTGNFEGRFASDFTGHLRWLDACHGDSYSIFVQRGVAYSASHSHDCSDMGGWDESTPQRYQRLVAESTAPFGKLAHNNNSGYADFFGRPKPRLLHWFPDVTVGNKTPLKQAAWSVTGNGRYLSVGGEFPAVNGKAQQGLVRFAIPSISHKTGPIPSKFLAPTLTQPNPTTVNVEWKRTWDRDNAVLTYQVLRSVDGSAFQPLSNSYPRYSTFWSRPTLSYPDATVSAGHRYRYKVTVVDPDGNKITGGSSAPLQL